LGKVRPNNRCALRIQADLFLRCFCRCQPVIFMLFQVFLCPANCNTAVYQSGQNVIPETPINLLSAPKIVFIGRTLYRSWKIVFVRLFGRAGWRMHTLLSNEVER
jgi:hypothetical protein